MAAGPLEIKEDVAFPAEVDVPEEIEERLRETAGDDDLALEE